MDSGKAFYAGLLEALTSVMGSAKGYLRDHGPMVAMLASRLGRELGLTKAECSELFFAAILSDMGMVGLAEDAWENPVPELEPDVRERVQRHPRRSEERVRGIPHLEDLAPLLRHHHEWWDGSGYPDGLSGEEIPIGARVLRLADTVSALSKERPHRGPMTPDQIADVVRSSIGTEFGPEIARCYLSLCDEGRVPSFDLCAYQDTVLDAAESLLPEQVSPLSTSQLLTIVANLIDAKDPYTAGHSRRVSVLAVAVAEQLELNPATRSALWAGGYLHDLGKLAVPLRVLAKNGRLTDEEFDYIKAHPIDGAQILEGIPTLQHLTAGVRYHHERWDGGGYPEGLSGERIPLVAQIMAVCDAYDAMTSKRAYRDSCPPEVALEEVERETGRQFGPTAAEAFLKIPETIFRSLQAEHPESLSEVPERVRTLRSIDPSFFAAVPVGGR
ncbi:MAG: HD domain-containing phosphohydrolase [Gemmatimonadota bacterium]|jgi:putative nucleotidyltransferase with HDIG domain